MHAVICEGGGPSTGGCRGAYATDGAQLQTLQGTS